jgi:rhodanese-related sulfurtransferase|tara:strand:- start:1114 stop:1446 length:333 start_codon:yes stop_codon:yes gene_type:complete
MKTITVEDLKKKIDANEDFILVDVLSNESYENKHIPKAINLPINELEQRAPNELPDKNKEVIVYCGSTQCLAPPRAAKKLEELGYTNVVDFESGLAGWKEAGYGFEGSVA